MNTLNNNIDWTSAIEIEKFITDTLGKVRVEFWRKPADNTRSVEIYGRGWNWKFTYDQNTLLGKDGVGLESAVKSAIVFPFV